VKEDQRRAVPYRGVNPRVDGVVTTTPDFRVGWS